MNTSLVYVSIYQRKVMVTWANDNGILPGVYESEPEFCSSTTGAE